MRQDFGAEVNNLLTEPRDKIRDLWRQNIHSRIGEIAGRNPDLFVKRTHYAYPIEFHNTAGSGASA